MKLDARIVKLVYKFLKAGYLEDWVYHKTYSGTLLGIRKTVFEK